MRKAIRIREQILLPEITVIFIEVKDIIYIRLIGLTDNGFDL